MFDLGLDRPGLLLQLVERLLQLVDRRLEIGRSTGRGRRLAGDALAQIVQRRAQFADALLAPPQPLAQRGIRLARRLRRELLHLAAQAVEARRHLVAAGDIVGEALFQRRHPLSSVAMASRSGVVAN